MTSSLRELQPTLRSINLIHYTQSVQFTKLTKYWRTWCPFPSEHEVMTVDSKSEEWKKITSEQWYFFIKATFLSFPEDFELHLGKESCLWPDGHVFLPHLNLCHITTKTSQHKTAFDPPLRKWQFHMNSPLTSWHTLKFNTTLIHQQQLYIYFITSFLSFRALINPTFSLPSLLS